MVRTSDLSTRYVARRLIKLSARNNIMFCDHKILSKVSIFLELSPILVVLARVVLARSISQYSTDSLQIAPFAFLLDLSSIAYFHPLLLAHPRSV
jgi:hypothetical protein